MGILQRALERTRYRDGVLPRSMESDGMLEAQWRRERDSNPRDIAAYTISSRARSATPAPLLIDHLMSETRAATRPRATALSVSHR
jgi:hypothetical protein